MEFDWDPYKAIRKFENHGVSFEEASTIFDDPFYITVVDDEHSDNEQRYISIGMSRSNRLIMVAHTARQGHTRIISARKATRNERGYYEEGF